MRWKRGEHSPHGQTFRLLLSCTTSTPVTSNLGIISSFCLLFIFVSDSSYESYESYERYVGAQCYFSMLWSNTVQILDTISSYSTFRACLFLRKYTVLSYMFTFFKLLLIQLIVHTQLNGCLTYSIQIKSTIPCYNLTGQSCVLKDDYLRSSPAANVV
jgi:hypothetical protein